MARANLCVACTCQGITTLHHQSNVLSLSLSLSSVFETVFRGLSHSWSGPLLYPTPPPPHPPPPPLFKTELSFLSTSGLVLRSLEALRPFILPIISLAPVARHEWRCRPVLCWLIADSLFMKLKVIFDFLISYFTVLNAPTMFCQVRAYQLVIFSWIHSKVFTKQNDVGIYWSNVFFYEFHPVSLLKLNRSVGCLVNHWNTFFNNVMSR